MKIQIDTEKKTIKMESDVELSELVDILEKLLPKNEWKKYRLKTETIINNWMSPVFIDRNRPLWWQEWDFSRRPLSPVANLCIE